MLCYPLTVVDGYSRFLLNCTEHILRRGPPRLGAVVSGARAATKGSDNGSPFASIGTG